MWVRQLGWRSEVLVVRQVEKHLVLVRESELEVMRLELVLALVVLIFGIVLVANPFKAMTTLLKLIGVGLIVGGVTDLISALYFVRKVDDAVHATYREMSSEPVGEETDGEEKTEE